jgi:hypothetical protein
MHRKEIESILACIICRYYISSRHLQILHPRIFEVEFLDLHDSKFIARMVDLDRIFLL